MRLIKPVTDDQQMHTLLLALLECKFRYYYPSYVHNSWTVLWPNDHEYDAMELLYEQRCGKMPAGYPHETYEGSVVARCMEMEYVRGSFLELYRRQYG